MSEESVLAADSHIPPGYDEKFYRIRHSLAHILAQAVLERYPGAKIAIGPPIRDGFYYDFDLPSLLGEDDLRSIENRMREIIAGGYAFNVREIEPQEARAMFRDQPYKIELMDGILTGEADEHGATEGHSSLPRLTVYCQDTFTDLCRGPHVANTKEIDPKAFKLTHTAGAYWRGDEHNKMLTRIYGTAWRTKRELDDYLARIEDAKKRDHRVLGRELGIFTNHELVGTGLPLWLPNGATIRRLLEEFIEELERKSGYLHVYTPDLAKRQLYERSGHWEHYKDAMFPPIELENEELVLRPMNCPHHILVFSNKPYSYRELPVRIAELGTMYRYEKSGVTGGLSRVRVMTLNDAHIFCRPDQIKAEFSDVMRLVEQAYATLGITEHRYRLSLHDPADKVKYVDNDAMWQMGEQVLREAMDDLGLPYTEAPGEAAFYGPKIDIQLSDLLGREETVSTVQIDFHLPEQFDLAYVGDDGKPHRPVIIHRGVISTMERMTAYLIELYAGAFPAWLAPTQAQVVPIATRHFDRAREVAQALIARDLRATVDSTERTLNAKIRDAQLKKVPFTLVVGDREVAENTVTVRTRGTRLQKTMPVKEFEDSLERLVRSHALTLDLGSS